MPPSNTAHGLEILMVLLMVASAVGMVVQWVKLPYSIALVIVGLTIGSCHLLPPVEMTPELILLVFLPALLFEASWNINLSDLTRDWKPILLLAVPGVIISMLVAGLFVHQFGGLSLPLALLFGAMTAATDPISVIALFRKLGIDKRLTLLLEAESLFNDGTAVVLFKLVLAITLGAASTSIAHSLGEFVLVMLGGAVVGVVIGLIGSQVTRFFEDHLLEITLTAIVAYGSYLVADQLKVSPVIAVLMAGIVVGNYGSRVHMSATTRLAVNSFWEYAAFLVNSIVFLLIGLQIDFNLLSRYSQTIAVGIVGIILARALVVYGLSPLLSRDKSRVPFRWQHLLFWGALRGSLTMALALSLPHNFVDREELIVLTFGVVLFTLLVPGLTIEPLVRILKVSSQDHRFDEYERLKARLYAETQALNSLVELFRQGAVSRQVYEQMGDEIRYNCRTLTDQIDDLHLTNAAIELMQSRQTRKQLLEVRKDSLLKLIRQHGTEREVVEPLFVHIDSQIDEIDGAPEFVTESQVREKAAIQEEAEKNRES